MKISKHRAVIRTIANNAFLLRQAMNLVWESAPALTIASIVLVFLQGILPLAALYLMKLIVDSVSTGASSREVLIFMGLAGGVVLLIAVCNSITNVISEAQSIMVSDRTQEILHAKSVEVDLVSRQY